MVYEIEINYGQHYFESFRIYIVSNSKQSIVLGTIQKLDYYSKIKRSKNFKVDREELNYYLTNHNIKYKQRLNQNDCIRQLTELIIYGYGCSESGSFYPKEAKKMLQYVKIINYKKLSKWLRQINPEIQAYAVDGLMRLDKNGIKVSDSDMAIIEHLAERNSGIYHCAGCLYGLNTTINKIIQLKQK